MIENSTVTSGAKLSMIGETGWLRKTNKQRTHLLSSSRGMRRRRPNHEMDRYVYIYIGHDSSVGVYFAKR